MKAQTTSAENAAVTVPDSLWIRWAGIRIKGETEQVLKVILYFTFGHGRHKAEIPRRVFEQLTGLNKGSISRALKDLSERNIITIAGDRSNGFIYSFNRKPNTWKG